MSMTKKTLCFAVLAVWIFGAMLLLSACGGSMANTVCANGHDWVYQYTNEATCTINASDVYVCTVCSEQRYEEKAWSAQGHRIENLVCTVCGYVAPIPEDTPDIVREGALLFTLNREKRCYTVRAEGKVQGACTIPECIYELPVTAVEAGGFKNQNEMTDITFPDCLTHIGKSAFEGCTGLAAVTLGQGVVTMGERAFHSCTGLLSVTMCKGVVQLGDRAFYGCTGLTEITVPESVEALGAAVFGGCGNLQRLVIPFVGSDSAIMRLYGCYYNLGHIFGKDKYSGAQKVTMDYHKVTNSGTRLDQATYYIPSSLEYVEVTVGNYYAMGSDTNRYLELGAFHNCTMIKEIVLAPSITIAQSCALEGLTNLQRLIAPGVRSGILRMQYTPALREIDCAYPTLRYDIPKVTLRGITAQTDLSHLADCNQIEELTLVFAKGHKKVKQAQLEPVLSKITGLGVTSPDTEIEADVLSSIATLKRAILPIEALAGLDMTYLEELTVLADRPYIISATVCASATALRSLTLDSHVTGFVEGAFENCTLLSSVTLDGTGEELFRDALVGRWLGLTFGGEGANPLCHGAALYFYTSEGRESLGAITLPESVSALGAFVFDGCSNLTSVTLGAHVRTIGQNAFRGTPALLTVYFDGTLAQWLAIEFAEGNANPLNGAQALYLGTAKVSALTSGTGITEISPYAFYGYLGLTSVSLGEGLLKVGTSAFLGCTGLTEVALPTTLTRVDARAFFGCTALTSVSFADPVGWYLFENATAMVGSPISDSVLVNAADAAEYFVTLYTDYIFKKVN